MFLKNKFEFIKLPFILNFNLIKTFFHILKMNLDNIFSQFSDQSEDHQPDDDVSLLVDFSEHPFYWINGFNKIIANHLYFKHHTIKMFKNISSELDEDDIEKAGSYLMYEKAWEYIKDININNQFHLECIAKKSSFVFLKNIKSSIQHFEQLEQYEKCMLLKEIEIKVKEFLI
jgi:hypothetical protein